MSTHRRDLRLWLLLTPVVLLVLAIALYAPVLWAWSARSESRQHPDGRDDTSVSAVMPTWIMRRAPFIYDPLLKLHARMLGWDFYGTQHSTIFADPQTTVHIFSRHPEP